MALGASFNNSLLKHNLKRAPEGQGGPDGIVLALTLHGDGLLDAFYTVDAFIGVDRLQVAMLVDTGSSDLWVASTNCQNSECRAVPLYNPSRSGVPTGQRFDIPYLEGRVTGPIHWDTFELGGYVLSHQALCAAEELSSEPLSLGFSGLLGLALQPNSIISQQLPPTLSDSPDGAPLSNNLFSQPNGPADPFFSLSLSRPGSSRIPSLLGIGRHPSELVTNTAAVKPIQLEPTSNGYAFWRTRLSISVWKEGTEELLNLGRNWPIAILDSGGPNIIASRQICDAVYGSWDIQADEHGQYQVPCDTPLNISLTLGHSSFPIHPLDLSYRSSSPGALYCIGTLQASNALSAPGAPADVILGVAFLRNVYMVMSQKPNNNTSMGIIPSLGLMSVTNISLAMEEWTRVRLHGGSIEPNGGQDPHTIQDTTDPGQGIELGKMVAIGVGAFVGACLLLFGIGWWLTRRRNRSYGLGPKPSRKTEYAGGVFGRIFKSKYHAARTNPDVLFDDVEDNLRLTRYNRLAEAAGLQTVTSLASDTTRVEEFGMLEMSRYPKHQSRPDDDDDAGTTIGTRYNSSVKYTPAPLEDRDRPLPQKQPFVTSSPSFLPSHDPSITPSLGSTSQSDPIRIHTGMVREHTPQITSTPLTPMSESASYGH